MNPSVTDGTPLTHFVERLADENPGARRAVRIDSLMLNVGLRCNLACTHCHQSSSPSRTESMTHATMLEALRLAAILRPGLLDITGGEPTLWHHLCELISTATARNIPVRVRTNLVALTHPTREALVPFFAENGVAILGSLPGVTAREIAEQRGDTFDASIAVLRTLAQFGYGSGNPRLVLDLAYNPPLGESQRPQTVLAEEFHRALEPLGVRFDKLLVIANVPAGRFAERLKSSGDYSAELDRLAGAFNPGVLGELACRCSVEVAWDGSLVDCDFNLGAGMRVVDGPRTLAEAFALADAGSDVDSAIAGRRIAFGPHCFACAAGSGSG